MGACIHRVVLNRGPLWVRALVIITPKALPAAPFLSSLCTSEAGAGTNQTVASPVAHTLSASQLILCDSLGRVAQKQGTTNFANNMTPSGDWDFDSWGANALAVTTNVPATLYTNGPGILYVAMNEQTSGERTAMGVVKARLYVASPKE